MNEKEIRYFSMFTGVGGFELGLENAGSKSNLQGRWNENSRSTQDLQDNRSESSNETTSFSCVGMSEIDKYASELLSKRFPRVKNYGDCTKINPRELPDFDLLCGGFPCQSFSIAGKRRGFEDTRGTMFFEIARILEVKRPKTVLLENVKGLLNHNKGETFRVILQTLDELGYETQWMVLNSKFHGVPQNRERVFIIGNLRGTSRSEILPFGRFDQEVNETNGEKIMIDVYNKKMRNECPTLSDPCHNNIRLAEKFIRNPYNGKTSSEETGTLGVSCGTTTGKTAQHLWEGMKIRRLTPTECERLQGFPENWTEGFSDTQRYKMMGNAVTVNVIKAIGEKIGIKS